MYLNIPAISAFEWHPFTVSSEPGTRVITHTIKCKEDNKYKYNNKQNEWTRKLFDLLKASQNHSNLLRDITLIVDGPYGNHSFSSFHNYKRVLLVAGGVGITPYASYIRSLDKEKDVATLQGEAMKLVWMVKHMSDVEPFQDLVRV